MPIRKYPEKLPPYAHGNEEEGYSLNKVSSITGKPPNNTPFTPSGYQGIMHGGIYNVRDYGAKGDNNNDDTQAIQDAIDECAANKTGSAVDGVVYFPPGKYKITNTINLNSAPRIWLVGTGRENSIINNAGTGTALVADNSSETYSQADFIIGFKSISIFGNDSSINGLEVDSGRVKAFNSAFGGHGGTGIELVSAFGSRFINCNFNTNSTDGMEMGTASNQITMIGCRFNGNERRGITINGGSALSILASIIGANNGRGIIINDGTGITIAFSHFEQYNTSYDDISEKGGTDTLIYHNYIGAEPPGASTLSRGIDLNGATHPTIKDNIYNIARISNPVRIPITGTTDAVIDNPRTDLNTIITEDSGTRTIINGRGKNAGDPNLIGDWNGNGFEGLIVRDTTNANTYIYNNGVWSQIASA